MLWAVKNGSARPARPMTQRKPPAPPAEPELTEFAPSDVDVPRPPGSPKAGLNGSGFPSLMSDDELDKATEDRRHELYDPFRQPERPDPWPIIERSFPRIAAAIRRDWGKWALDDYLSKLAMDDRGGRQGFPPDVLSAIMEIARLHASRFDFPHSMCPWEADVQQMKWWSKR